MQDVCQQPQMDVARGDGAAGVVRVDHDREVRDRRRLEAEPRDEVGARVAGLVDLGPGAIPGPRSTTCTGRS
jgi:hypothetical protein